MSSRIIGGNLIVFSFICSTILRSEAIRVTITKFATIFYLFIR